MSLTRSPITELTTETAPLLLLDEWLAQYFDGGLHAVGVTADVRFPKCNRAYNQSPPAHQPFFDQGADTFSEIRTLMLPRAESPLEVEGGKLVSSFVLFNFWISAKKPGKGQSAAEADFIANRLKAIITNPDTRYPLAERGVTHLTPHLPQILPDADYAKRLIACGATLFYPVNFGETTVSAPWELSVGYLLEAPLIAGDYILGNYQWGASTVLIAARVICWPPQVSDVVLGLEVDGVLTGHTITIPIGPVNVETIVNQVLNVAVAPNQPVRWKVLSAPEPENSAWHLSLTLQVQPQ